MSSHVSSGSVPDADETPTDSSLVPSPFPSEFVRTYKEREFRPRRTTSGLTLREAFELEREAYRRIGDRSHFSRLIRCSEDPYRLILTHCGASFNRLPESLSVPNLRDQIESILDVLESSGIVHVDIARCNACYDPTTSVVSLIDFDKIVLDGVPSTRRLATTYERFSSDPRGVQRKDFHKHLRPWLS